MISGADQGRGREETGRAGGRKGGWMNRVVHTSSGVPLRDTNNQQNRRIINSDVAAAAATDVASALRARDRETFIGHFVLADGS